MHTLLQHTNIIAGPCSAESFSQLEAVISQLVYQGITTIRAGVWKPRTRPNQFEGRGEQALDWLRILKKKYAIKVATEVASPYHVEMALKYEVDTLWIGARTSVNPFGVQEIANALKGVDISVMVKNPVNPDLSLWIGAIERIQHAGIKKISAIHRGFSSFQQTRYRNPPMWQIPIEFKTKLDEIPLLCDPSHITGNREMIAEICQKALDLNYDGLMIETHHDPDHALSDAKQQITPRRLIEILHQLQLREASPSDAVFINRLEELRDKIDHLDREVIESMAARMKIVKEIAHYKRENNITILQIERWKEIIRSRTEWAKILDLDPDLILSIYQLIHQESIRQQTNILNNNHDDITTN